MTSTIALWHTRERNPNEINFHKILRCEKNNILKGQQRSRAVPRAQNERKEKSEQQYKLTSWNLCATDFIEILQPAL